MNRHIERVNTVGVGIMIAHNPLHGSGRAGLPHPALTLGDNAHAAQRIRMTRASRRQPTVDQAPHPSPRHARRLATPQQSAVPELTHLKSKRLQRRAVCRHTVVADVSTHDRTQPLAHLRDGIMQAQSEFGLDLAQLRLPAFAYRLPYHRISPIAPLLSTDVGEAKKMKRFRLPRRFIRRTGGPPWHCMKRCRPTLFLVLSNPCLTYLG